MDILVSKTANVDFYIKRGDTFYFNFQVQNINNNPVDLSQYTIATMSFKSTEYAPASLTFTGATGSTGQINIDNLDSGQIIINGSSSPLSAGSYYYDLELSKVNNFIETVLSGQVFVEYDYSN